MVMESTMENTKKVTRVRVKNVSVNLAFYIY
jgi:hypothetical protein